MESCRATGGEHLDGVFEPPEAHSRGSECYKTMGRSKELSGQWLYWACLPEACQLALPIHRILQRQVHFNYDPERACAGVMSKVYRRWAPGMAI